MTMWCNVYSVELLTVKINLWTYDIVLARAVNVVTQFQYSIFPNYK